MYAARSCTAIEIYFNLVQVRPESYSSQGFRDEWYNHARAKPFVRCKLGQIPLKNKLIEKHYFTDPCAIYGS
ncbi:hypothetical protein GCM10023206_18670 [Acinetobacter puyangensis]